MLDTIPPWLAIIDSLKWIVFITLLIILAIINRKTLMRWIGRSKTIKVDAFGVKFESEQQQILPAKQDKSPLDKALTIFRPQTLDLFKGFVQKETKYEEISSDKERFEVLLKYSVALYIIYRFEFIYDIIFGSQIQILQLLNSKGPQTLDIFKHYFDQVKQKYPEVFGNTDGKNYANFLYSSELVINTKEQTVSITILGIDFLKYIMDCSKNIYKDY